jgi:hypothetical protein
MEEADSLARRISLHRKGEIRFGWSVLIMLAFAICLGKWLRCLCGPLNTPSIPSHSDLLTFALPPPG